MKENASSYVYKNLNIWIATLHHFEEDGAIGYRYPTSILSQSVHLVQRLSANFDIFEWQSHIFQK